MTSLENLVTLIVPEENSGMRIDKAIAVLHPDLSRSRIKSLILEGQIFVNSTMIDDPNFKLSVDQTITLKVPPPSDGIPEAENIPLDIMYEDDDLLIINKHAGMVVHPGAGNHSGTLVNALLYHCKDSLSGIGGVLRPGIVHRLDKDTSGLMVVAKNDHAHQALSNQLADRSLSRLYIALAWRIPVPLKGSVDAPIGRHKTNRLKMAVHQHSGREAKTLYHMQDCYHDIVSLLHCKLTTGRTHQIRVHMAHIKHALVGDPLYGLPLSEIAAILKKSNSSEQQQAALSQFSRQALHAAEIRFIHPRSGIEICYNAPLPDDLSNLIQCLKSDT